MSLSVKLNQIGFLWSLKAKISLTCIINIIFNCLISDPPVLEAPTLLRVTGDLLVVMRLSLPSVQPMYDNVQYYVVVVPANERRGPESVHIDEVLLKLFTIHPFIHSFVRSFLRIINRINH